jgi:cell wall-associated NlpC family hydrolase
MTRDEAAQRAAVVSAARLWVNTPWKHKAHVLGHGVDCAHHLLETGVRSGMVKRFDPEFYTHDWHWHRDEERFLAAVGQHAAEVGEGQASIKERGRGFTVLPGNVLLWKNGRTFSHGAIVSEWPMVIHASFPARICLEESVYGGILETSPVRIFSYWGR